MHAHPGVAMSIQAIMMYTVVQIRKRCVDNELTAIFQSVSWLRVPLEVRLEKDTSSITPFGGYHQGPPDSLLPAFD